MKFRPGKTAFGSAALCALLLNLADAQAETEGPATDRPIRVSSCQQITQTGRYVLTRSIQAPAGLDCIQVLAPAVELDLGGFEIRGHDGPAAAGVNAIAAAANDTFVHNGSISGFSVGVVLQSGVVKGLNISGVDHGIYVGSGAVLDNDIRAAQTGVLVHDARVVANEVVSGAVGITCGLRCSSVRNTLTEYQDWAADGAVELAGGLRPASESAARMR
jgi:hypothetical protein